MPCNLQDIQSNGTDQTGDTDDDGNATETEQAVVVELPELVVAPTAVVVSELGEKLLLVLKPPRGCGQ